MDEYSALYRMNVRELITALESLNPDMLVLVDGYEGGYQAPEVQRHSVAQDRWPNYCGPWSDAEHGEEAVIISRNEDTNS
jgi:hypothetical protein